MQRPRLAKLWVVTNATAAQNSNCRISKIATSPHVWLDIPFTCFVKSSRYVTKRIEAIETEEVIDSVIEPSEFCEFRPAGVDPAPAAAARSRLQNLGYGIRSACELALEEPAWQRSYFALEQAVLADVPFLGPLRVEPYEQFLRRLADPTQFNPNATFVARRISTGEFAGLSLLFTYEEIPGYAFAGLTGTVRPHRRRGIARALKLATLDYARSNGIDRIVTLNEESNPMLTLNRALGFETRHVQLTLSKCLHAGEPG